MPHDPPKHFSEPQRKRPVFPPAGVELSFLHRFTLIWGFGPFSHRFCRRTNGTVEPQKPPCNSMFAQFQLKETPAR